MINAGTFVYEDSRLRDLYMHLKNCGVDVYMPGIKTGECLEQYVVVKNDGLSRIEGISSSSSLYAVMCYSPQESYSELEVLVENVKRYMKDLEPMFMPTGFETPSFYDDSIKAHMISIQYRNSRKN